MLFSFRPLHQNLKQDIRSELDKLLRKQKALFFLKNTLQIECSSARVAIANLEASLDVTTPIGVWMTADLRDLIGAYGITTSDDIPDDVELQLEILQDAKMYKMWKNPQFIALYNDLKKQDFERLGIPLDEFKEGNPTIYSNKRIAGNDLYRSRIILYFGVQIDEEGA